MPGYNATQTPTERTPKNQGFAPVTVKGQEVAPPANSRAAQLPLVPPPAPLNPILQPPGGAGGGGSVGAGGAGGGGSTTGQAVGGAAPVSGMGGGNAIPGAPGGLEAKPTIQGAFSTALQRLLSGPTPQEAAMNVGQSPAVKAFKTQQQQQEERDRAFLAERAAAGGFSGSGGFESGLMNLKAQRGFNEAQFAGGEAARVEEGRRNELMQGLALALQMGDNDAARALQRELGMGSLNVANNRLGFDIANAEAQMNALALQSLLGGY